MGNEQKRIEVFGFLKDEGSKLGERCATLFIPRRSSRVLRGKGVTNK
jgi:hypothetical protein